MSPLDMELLCQGVYQVSGMEAHHLRDRHYLGKIVNDDDRVNGYLVLALGVCIERIDYVLGVSVSLKVDLDVRCIGGEVVDRGDVELALLRGILDRIDHLLTGNTVRQLRDDYLLGI